MQGLQELAPPVEKGRLQNAPQRVQAAPDDRHVSPRTAVQALPRNALHCGAGVETATLGLAWFSGLSLLPLLPPLSRMRDRAPRPEQQMPRRRAAGVAQLALQRRARQGPGEGRGEDG
jgi:hypothetical protein